MINIDLCVFLWYQTTAGPGGTETSVNRMAHLYEEKYLYYVLKRSEVPTLPFCEAWFSSKVPEERSKAVFLWEEVQYQDPVSFKH